MRIGTSVLPLLFLACSSAPGSPCMTVQNQIDGTGCHLKVPEPYNSGYADFSVVLSFRVGARNAPVDLLIVRNPAQIAKGEILRCVKGWLFSSSIGSETLFASFRWEHNKGWSSLRISGPDSGLICDVKLAGRG